MKATYSARVTRSVKAWERGDLDGVATMVGRMSVAEIRAFVSLIHATLPA